MPPHQVVKFEFFKYIKPKFYQWLIYYQEKYTLESRKPMENGKALQRYFEEQLKFYDRFFRQNEFHYQYYKLWIQKNWTTCILYGVPRCRKF